MIRARRPKILLFDIDGTLILTAGAGVRAMTRAFEDMFGVAEGLAGIPMAGRTDSVILAEAMQTAQIDPVPTTLERFRMRYVSILTEEIERPSAAKRILPGIAELLPALARRSDVFLALVTGNFSDAAQVKLDHFGLWKFFACGAFGEEAHDRNVLVPIAIERAGVCGASVGEASDVIVIGDTPHDVRCAAAAGARSVGVATGPCDAEMLAASGADVVFRDLSDTDAFLQLLE